MDNNSVKGDYEDVLDVISALQEGDFDIVREAISTKLVPLNATDRDGCSLLHWAAINNRTDIACFLIDSGLSIVSGGGVLQESPLQWALRKKYYAMADLLFQRTRCDLAHKSVQGLDALHLACRIGDINAVFLLLHWGASPNTVDNNGDTPLLWLAKNRTGHVTIEIVRLLLRFGADALAQNERTGDTCMHSIAANRKADLTMAFIIFQAGGMMSDTVANKEGVTPYNTAVTNENRRIARFLFDATMFNFFPYWTPTLVSALLSCSFFLFIYLMGLFYGLLYWIFAYTLLSWILLQHSITDHRGRVYTGAFFGVIASLIVSSRAYVGVYLSSSTQLYTWTMTFVLLYSLYLFYSTKPLHSKAENRAVLAANIVKSAPMGGPDEEIEEWLKDNKHNSNSYINDDSAMSPMVTDGEDSSAVVTLGKTFRTGKIKLKRDPISGKMVKVEEDQGSDSTFRNSFSNRVNNSYSSSNNLLIEDSPKVPSIDHYSNLVGFKRPRTIGGRLCGACLCDKRAVYTIQAPTNTQNDYYCMSSSKKDMPIDSMTQVPQSLPAMSEVPPIGNSTTAVPSWKSIATLTASESADYHSYSRGNSAVSKGYSSAATTMNLGANSGRKSMNGLNSYKNNNSSTPIGVISIATHCNTCRACVTDMDHHSPFLGNCVGRGNRRYFFLVLFCCFLGSATYFLLSKWIQHSLYCANSHGMLWSFFAVESCMMDKSSTFFMLTWLSFFFAMYFALSLQLHFVIVAHETTLTMFVRRNNEDGKLPKPDKAFKTVLTFLFNGKYSVKYKKSTEKANYSRRSNTGSIDGTKGTDKQSQSGCKHCNHNEVKDEETGFKPALGYYMDERGTPPSYLALQLPVVKPQPLPRLPTDPNFYQQFNLKMEVMEDNQHSATVSSTHINTDNEKPEIFSRQPRGTAGLANSNDDEYEDFYSVADSDFEYDSEFVDSFHNNKYDHYNGELNESDSSDGEQGSFYGDAAEDSSLIKNN